jgi:hypothetical protein
MATTAATRRTGAAHRTILSDPACYSAHPHLAVATDGTWLLVFTQAPRAPVILHPPLDPRFCNMLMRSEDEGRSWSPPEPVPGPDVAGVECAGLTPLPDGSVLLNQWRFGWHDPTGLTAAERVAAAMPEALARSWTASSEFSGLRGGLGAREVLGHFPKARLGGRTLVARARDGRAPFIPLAEIATHPFSGGYGMRGGLVLPDGAVLLPLSDVPHYRRVFTVRSEDGGATWGAPVPVAEAAGAEFEEPAPLLLPGGRVLLVLRDNGSRILHVVSSDDGGRSWGAPRPTGITGYPADLLVLPSGGILLVAGRRTAPFGIELHRSDDGGHTWGPGRVLRDDLPDADLGYPTMARRANGEIVVVYYCRDGSGVTGLQATVLPDDGPETGM